jgi:hypothetical protein
MRTQKPTATDIVDAIGIIERDEWIDTGIYHLQTCWSAEVYMPDGRCVGNGSADTPGLAMAMAWICYWDNDALCRGEVEEEYVPLTVPDGWRFELTPPDELARLPYDEYSRGAR